MSGSLLPVVSWRVVDSDGAPVAGALLATFLTDTLTNAPTYTDQTLGTPLPNPVSADGGGLLPSVFLDPAVTYRFQVKTAAGAIIDDIDPFSVAEVIANGSVTGAMLAAGAAASNLGYTALNKGGDTTGGELIIGATLSVPPDVQSVGFRGMPPITRNAVYAFAPEDSGRLQRHTDGTAYAWTIQPNSAVPFAIGTVIPFRNFGAGIITLTRGAGVTLAISGSGTSKDVAVAQYGAGGLVKEDTDTWYVQGTNLS